MKSTKILVMAGGIGSRFWPKSTENSPKQFIDILGVGKSLLQLTVDRFTSDFELSQIYILTNVRYYELVKSQLPGLPLQNILIEPSRNNTAPCIAYAGYKIWKEDPESIMVVVPSDHVILKEEVYKSIVKKGILFAFEHDAIVTLGIKPSRPDTGYGYIEYEKGLSSGIYKVASFKEKPPENLAQEYLDQGNFLWNAGMFIWKAQQLKEELERFAPDVAEIFEKGLDILNTEEESAYISVNYPKCPNISIDYAVLEKSKKVYTIPADIGWSDLGTWGSLHEILEKDDLGNSGRKKVIRDCRNTTIHIEDGKQVIVRGLDNFIVVDEPSALLIYPKEHEQEIKEDVQRLMV